MEQCRERFRSNQTQNETVEQMQANNEYCRRILAAAAKAAWQEIGN